MPSDGIILSPQPLFAVIKGLCAASIGVNSKLGVKHLFATSIEVLLPGEEDLVITSFDI